MVHAVPILTTAEEHESFDRAHRVMVGEYWALRFISSTCRGLYTGGCTQWAVHQYRHHQSISRWEGGSQLMCISQLDQRRKGIYRTRMRPRLFILSQRAATRFWQAKPKTREEDVMEFRFGGGEPLSDSTTNLADGVELSKREVRCLNKVKDVLEKSCSSNTEMRDTGQGDAGWGGVHSESSTLKITYSATFIFKH